MFSLRLDREASIYLIHPFMNLHFRRSESAVPILMYHSICQETHGGRSPYYRTNTSPGAFRAQMEFLYENGYSAISLEEALPILRGQTPPRRRIAVITFDDGCRSVLTEAYPVLCQFGFTATVFIATAFISDTREAFNGKPCLTWNEITELRRAGLHFGSHTVNHPELCRIDWSQVETELRCSKRQIERRLGERVVTFAYPYAYPEEHTRFTSRLGALLAAAGYAACATTRIGCAQIGESLLSLKRLPVNACDDLRLFRAKLDGAYDWLGYPQLFSKALKHWLRTNLIAKQSA